MSHSLEGKVAVVTGGSTGIGLGIAKRFVSEGAAVVITGRRQAELDAAVAEIGSKASAFRADVAVLSDLDALYEEVRKTHGRIDVLVANAGGASLAKLGEITEEHYDKTFAINVKGVLFTVQKALPLMEKGGSIIVTGSTVSVMGTEAFSVYSGTKAAIRNFVRSWIIDLKGRNIRVNVLSPGPIDTPALREIAGAAEGFIEAISAQVPLGRIGDPDETGKVAVFLASDASSFVNGAELFVDGGLAQF